MHGDRTQIARKAPYLRLFEVVTFLHAVHTGIRARNGSGLPEVLIALTVFGTGVVGVAAMGGAARRMANVASLRTSQTIAASRALEDAPVSGSGPAVVVDTVPLSPGLVELRVTVTGSTVAGPAVWITRRVTQGL